MDDAADEVGGKILLDFKDTAGDRIQVFLEWHTPSEEKVNTAGKHLKREYKNVKILFVPWMRNVLHIFKIKK